MSSSQEQETCRVRMLHISAIPDTLYMVDEQHCSSAPYAVSPVSTVDIIAGTIPGQFHLAVVVMCLGINVINSTHQHVGRKHSLKGPIIFLMSAKYILQRVDSLINEHILQDILLANACET